VGLLCAETSCTWHKLEAEAADPDDQPDPVRFADCRAMQICYYQDEGGIVKVTCYEAVRSNQHVDVSYLLWGRT